MTLAPGIQLEGTALIEGNVLFAPLSLTLDAGRWTCLLGGSGVGKTTLLRLVAGLDTGADFSGNINSSDDKTIADRVAYMAQDDLLLPWATVSQNVALGARLRGETINATQLKQMLARVGLLEHMQKRPNQLSGGQRQRVALARTLIENKPIILLDEPFSALDAQTRADMQELTAELLEGRTVFLVTHDPNEAARLGNNIYILTRDGLSKTNAPSDPVPRDANAPSVLQIQAELLTKLRKSTS